MYIDRPLLRFGIFAHGGDDDEYGPSIWGLVSQNDFAFSVYLSDLYEWVE